MMRKEMDDEKPARSGDRGRGVPDANKDSKQRLPGIGSAEAETHSFCFFSIAIMAHSGRVDQRSSFSDRSDLDIKAPSVPSYSPPKPSFRLLFTFCTPRDKILLIVPAVCASLAAGGVAPFMTQVIGTNFNAFSRFAASTDTSESAKHDLLKTVGLVGLELVALAAGSLALSSVMSSLWIFVGERNAMRLRKHVYEAVSTRELEWFDTTMGSETGLSDNAKEGGESGVGGMMAKFAKYVTVHAVIVSGS